VKNSVVVGQEEYAAERETGCNMLPRDEHFLPNFAKLFGTRICLDVRDFFVAKTSGMKNCLKKIC
jgi:hypothetical protein